MMLTPVFIGGSFLAQFGLVLLFSVALFLVVREK